MRDGLRELPRVGRQASCRFLFSYVFMFLSAAVVIVVVIVVVVVVVAEKTVIIVPDLKYAV